MAKSCRRIVGVEEARVLALAMQPGARAGGSSGKDLVKALVTLDICFFDVLAPSQCETCLNG